MSATLATQPTTQPTTQPATQPATQSTAAAPDSVLRIEVSAVLVHGTATQVDVRTPAHRFTIDEPAALGGTDLGANPVEHLFAALAGCTVITFQVWAAKLGLVVDDIDVAVRGDLDTRGFFGLDDSVRPGFPEIELAITVSGPQTPAEYTRLADAVEEHCPVLDNLAPGAKVVRSLSFSPRA